MGTEASLCSLVNAPPFPSAGKLFQYGEFREQSFGKGVQSLEHFVQVMKKKSVQHCLCVATSAFRTASNAPLLINEVKKNLNLSINIIGGDLESILSLMGVQRELEEDLIKAPHILIDLGGGSTEVTLAKERKPLRSLSIEVGTIRLLQKMDTPTKREKALKLLTKTIAQRILPQIDFNEASIPIVGTGGNFRRMGKLKTLLLNKQDSSYMKNSHFHAISEKILETPYEKRVQLWGLSPNRAQVIEPACLILKACLKDLPWKKIYLPQGGLVDGSIEFLVGKLDGRKENENLFPSIQITTFS